MESAIDDEPGDPSSSSNSDDSGEWQDASSKESLSNQNYSSDELNEMRDSDFLEHRSVGSYHENEGSFVYDPPSYR